MTNLAIQTPRNADLGLVASLGAAPAFADFLFFDSVLGVNTALFLFIVTAGASILRNDGRLTAAAATLLALIAGQSVALLIQPSLLSVMLSSLLILALIVTRGGAPKGLIGVDGLTGGLGRFVQDCGLRIRSLPALWLNALRERRSTDQPRGEVLLRRWGAPIGAGLLFAGLIISANPVIETTLLEWSPHISISRLAMIFGVALGAWCLLSTPVRGAEPWMRDRAGKWADGAGRWRERLIDPIAIRRALMLCNLLFLVQTTTDAAFLWGGAGLPDGLTYAEYAHRGVFPLAIMAVLAGGFALLVSADDPSRLRRGLLILWIGQSLFTLISAMARLDLYVAVYGLTWLRVIGFFCMGLMAIGLALILARLIFRLSAGWLVRSNAIAVFCALYLFSFVDVAGVIADVNLANSRDMGGPGEWLDIAYLERLGPSALPALTRFLDQRGPRYKRREDAQAAHDRLRAIAQIRQDAWRSWRWRDQISLAAAAREG